MFVLKKLIFLSFLFLISNCSLNNIQNPSHSSFEIQTSNDKYNIYLKKHLERLFVNKENATNQYILSTTISFISTNTLSVSGTNELKSTKAIIRYNLRNKQTDEIINSGSIKSFSALSSSSSSFYSQQKSIEHIKERLTRDSAKSLYMHLKILVRRLN